MTCNFLDFIWVNFWIFLEENNLVSNGPLGRFDFSGKLNHSLNPKETTSPLVMSSTAPSTSASAAHSSQSTPILIKKSFKHVLASAPTFSLQKQILLHNAHVYEKGNSNLIHSIIGSKQPQNAFNMNNNSHETGKLYFSFEKTIYWIIFCIIF